ncbi:MAG: hypothetical protein U0790_15705 [Isosphaeraceae bacterium]
MDSRTFKLMVFYAHNACGSDDVALARAEMASAGRILGRYGIQLCIWPDDRGPHQNTIVPKLSGFLGFERDVDPFADNLMIRRWVGAQFPKQIEHWLPVVFCRFRIENERAAGLTFPDKAGWPIPGLKKYVFINTNKLTSETNLYKSVLAHEIVHAAGVADENKTNTNNLMYENASLQKAGKDGLSLDASQLGLMSNVFFQK